MATRWGEEILPSGSGDESFEAIVAWVYAILLLEIQRGLVGAHCIKEVGGRYECRELKFGDEAAAGNIHRVESWPVHAKVNGRSVGRARRTLEAGKVSHPALSVVRADALRGLGGVTRSAVVVREQGGPAPVGELIGVAGGDVRRVEHVLHTLGECAIRTWLRRGTVHIEELKHVENDMGQVLNRAVVEVVAGNGGRQVC